MAAGVTFARPVAVGPTNAGGETTSTLKSNGLSALPDDVVTCTAPVVAKPGTLVTILPASMEAKTGCEALLKRIAVGLDKRSPLTVTIAPGLPPGGCTNRMRGPPSLAIRTPVSVPSPNVPELLQFPAAVPTPTFRPVSPQVMLAHGGRTSTPRTAVWLATVDCS